MTTSDNIAAVSPLESMTPIAHLVWRNVLVAPDDAVDYYEVARAGDKCADGSEPFPVYTAGDLLALVRETMILKAGIKRLSDEEELLAETTDGDEFTLVSIAAKLAAAEAALLAEARKAEAMEQEMAEKDARIAALEAALMPFASHKTADGLPNGLLRIPDGHPVLFNGLGNGVRVVATIGDIRRARTLLNGGSDAQG